MLYIQFSSAVSRHSSVPIAMAISVADMSIALLLMVVPAAIKEGLIQKKKAKVVAASWETWICFNFLPR